jgi:hypothetical protein
MQTNATPTVIDSEVVAPANPATPQANVTGGSTPDAPDGSTGLPNASIIPMVGPGAPPTTVLLVGVPSLSTGATSVALKRALDAAFTVGVTTIGTTPSVVITDTGLSPFTAYYYRADMTNGTGTTPGAEARAETSSAAVVPAPVVGLSGLLRIQF